MKNKTLAILAPCYSGDFDLETKQSINNLKQEYPDLNIITLTSKEVYIHRGRRILLDYVLRLSKMKQIDYVLWLDSDVVFEPIHVKKLLNNIEQDKLKCVSGVYFNRHENNHAMICNETKEGLNWNINLELNKLIKVTGVGFGFFMFPIGTLRLFASRYKPIEWFDSSKWYPYNKPVDEQVFVVGEDIDFCKKLWLMNIPVIVNTSVLLKHKNITFDDYVKWKNANTWFKHCDVKISEINVTQQAKHLLTKE